MMTRHPDEPKLASTSVPFTAQRALGVHLHAAEESIHSSLHIASGHGQGSDVCLRTRIAAGQSQHTHSPPLPVLLAVMASPKIESTHIPRSQSRSPTYRHVPLAHQATPPFPFKPQAM